MPYPFTNRKRIRGWPNMLRKLSQLEDRHRHIDTNILDSYGYNSYELDIAPFSNLTKRNPPGWFFRKYVESLFRVSQTWKAELEGRYQQFYLAIWVFSPREAQTQLVCAVGERIDYYRNLFRRKDGEIMIPQSIQKLSEGKEWEQYWDYEPYWKDEDELTQNDEEYLAKKSATMERIGEDIYYLIPQGTVWVNEINPNQSAHTTPASAPR